MSLEVDDFTRLQTTRAERANPAGDVRIQLIGAEDFPLGAFPFLKNVGAGAEFGVIVPPILPETIVIVQILGTLHTSPKVGFRVDDERNVGEFLGNSQHHINVEFRAFWVYFNVSVNVPPEFDRVHEFDASNQPVFNLLGVLQEGFKIIHEAVTETRTEVFKGCRIAPLVARCILRAGDDAGDGESEDTFTEFDIVFGDGDGFGRGDVKFHDGLPFCLSACWFVC